MEQQLEVGVFGIKMCFGVDWLRLSCTDNIRRRGGRWGRPKGEDVGGGQRGRTRVEADGSRGGRGALVNSVESSTVNTIKCIHLNLTEHDKRGMWGDTKRS